MAATPSMVLDDLVEPEDFPAWFTIGTVADFFPARFTIGAGILPVAWIVLHHKTRDAFAEPVVESVLVACGFLEVVGVTTFDDIAEDWEHLWEVFFCRFADEHDYI